MGRANVSVFMYAFALKELISTITIGRMYIMLITANSMVRKVLLFLLFLNTERFITAAPPFCALR